MDGDGIGGQEKKLKHTSTREECVKLVIKTQPKANGVTYESQKYFQPNGEVGGNKCYAEFGATGTNGDSSWQTCILGNAFCSMILCCLQNLYNDIIVLRF